MITPREVQVWYILPALRRQLAIAIKRSGLKQKEIASILNLTEPAVSQYLKGKRGEQVIFSKEIQKEIRRSAKIIVKYPKKVNSELQKIFKKVNESKFICSVCKDHIHTENGCNVC